MIAATWTSSKQPLPTRLKRALAPIAGRRCRTWACVLLGIHAALLAWSAARQAPTFNEPTHLTAGIWQWRHLQFDLNRGNPPLLGFVAAAPVLLADPQFDRMSDFLTANGERSFWLITLGRWACLPFSLIGGYVCFLWARRLYGRAAGLFALALWCFCPLVLDHGQLITGDMASTALGLLACYTFWNWLRRPTGHRALLAGLALGLAQLAKYVCLVFYALWPVVWLAWRLRAPPPRFAGWRRETLHLSFMLVISVYLINSGYVFDGTFSALSDFKLGDRLWNALPLRGTDEAAPAPLPGWLGRLPVPLPADYLRGIDEIQASFDADREVYLRGTVRRERAWDYFLYGLFVKLPLGFWLVVQLAILSLFFRGRHCFAWPYELPLLVPVAGILLFLHLSSSTQHLRYALPVVPFLILFASRTARAFRIGDWPLGAAAGIGLAWAALSSLWVYPHSGSYFNEWAGGPKQGHHHLIGSSIDWGQDLLYLQRWLDRHPEARPLHLAYYGRADPRLAGIEFSLPPRDGPDRAHDEPLPPQPGWHAVSVSLLRGNSHPAHDGQGGFEPVGRDNYRYFLEFEPAAMAGYSIYIYHVTPEDVDAYHAKRRDAHCTTRF